MEFFLLDEMGVEVPLDKINILLVEITTFFGQILCEDCQIASNIGQKVSEKVSAA